MAYCSDRILLAKDKIMSIRFGSTQLSLLLILLAGPLYAETAAQPPLPAPGNTPSFRDAFRDHSGAGPEMQVIPAGQFKMGRNEEANSSPEHQVTIARSFALDKYEVTVAEWIAVMGQNEWNDAYLRECGPQCPAIDLSWNKIQQFIEKLNAQTGQRYRLPSEAEWEYACRAGQTTDHCNPVNNNPASHPDGLYPVGQSTANAWGLYDMNGNACEWVQDRYHDHYRGAPHDGRAWESGTTTLRVIRGGSGNTLASQREAFPGEFMQGGMAQGFRIARNLP